MIGLYDIDGVDVYSKNIAIDSFMDNTQLTFGRYAGTNYFAIRIYRTRIDGTKQYPFVQRLYPEESVPSVVAREGWLFAVNGGIGQGLTIQNSVLITDTPSSLHQGALPLTINNQGDLWYTEADTTGKGSTYISQGVVSAVCGFFPIVVNNTAFDYPDVSGTSESDWQRAQRQVIGQFANGDYIFIVSQGRGYDNSQGFTMEELQELCISLGIKFAYNLDGGGSVQTVLGRKLFTDIGTGELRNRPSLIGFNGTTQYIA